MTLARRLYTVILLLRVGLPLIQAQNELIGELHDTIRRQHLDYLHEMQALIASWRIHHETPEIDLRDDLSVLANTLANQAAALEEHVV